MKARVGDLELEYDTFGKPGDPALLLIMGLGTQMIAWPEAFCEALAAKGFRVIRYDNRDIGLSTHLDQLPQPSNLDLVLRRVRPAYTLDDMAADAAGLLDALGINRAHIVGASMGGMIAQLVAINHPDRVLSLTSIMSAVGGRDTVAPSLRVLGRLLLPTPKTREGRIRRQVDTARLLAGGNPVDEERLREFATVSIDRSYHPTGMRRQLAASAAAPSRRAALARLRVPALVVHGLDDPLVPRENGRRTAAAIPGARLLEIAGMGHNLPPQTWPELTGAIAEVAQQAEALQTLS
jgi:pimeloyl-ACP methyl ester carboxylesterase